ncbi:MAG TPA: hypothetical protein IAA98_06595 [Candidatus Avipropionibacterium avicola]|uniref:Uncharacterized protein n=1 Tax=Candidatus Avipropionibacterium avicola TaxID=2840701 RepID=A0A9D1GX69_9ACTN|nr:hypothetical protein [Candidatus Avipropionibacterium avicola]
MSELHCPARFVVFSDADAPEVVDALGREHIALAVTGQVDPRLTDAATVPEALADLADRYRGECVSVQLAPEVRNSLDDTTPPPADQQITLLP